MDAIITSLGYNLIKNDTFWEIDLTNLKIFTGLSVLSTIIAENIIEQVENNPGDISFLYKVNPNINPELIQMRVFNIQVYARSGILKDVLRFKEEFHSQIRTIFGTFQRPEWWQYISPETHRKNGKSALVFPFYNTCDNEYLNYQYLLECCENPNVPGEYFFRLSIETHPESYLNIGSIPHVLVDDLQTRVFISGSTKMAESIRDGIMNACNRGLKMYTRENRPHSHIFEQLEHTCLGKLKQINLYWEKWFNQHLHEVDQTTRLSFFKKLFLALEAGALCDILKQGENINIRVGKVSFMLFMSQLGRVLNISINLPRKEFHIDHYLERMPALRCLAYKHNHTLDFTNARIFLIHHITSDIIAFIAALKHLHPDAISVLFVKYGGLVPSSYLNALLENQSELLYMTGLERKVSEKNKDYYFLSEIFSDKSTLAKLDNYMEEAQLNFFEAMHLAAGHIFIRFCQEAHKEGKKVLLIEDGGYLAPFLNEFALSGWSTREVFGNFQIEDMPEEEEFAAWLDTMVIGTVEHTKNGHDRLQRIAEKYNRLFLPAYSIAVSKNKIIEESQEVAHSILSAIESVLHGQGMVLSQRKVMVLGADGNIGSKLCQLLLDGRLHANNKQIIHVDIRYVPDQTAYCYPTVDAIPDDHLLSRDLFIGVIGESILKREHLERIILFGLPTRLIFASGSTKTLEFSDLTNWLYEISSMDSPCIAGIPVEVEYDRIIDPQSGIDQGGRVFIRFCRQDQSYVKELMLLSDLSPVNFLFYGVPSEAMDMVLSQLLKVSLGMYHQNRTGKLPTPGLFAVDIEIDAWGNALE